MFLTLSAQLLTGDRVGECLLELGGSLPEERRRLERRHRVLHVREECLEVVAEQRERTDEVVLILGRSRVGGRALQGFVALLEPRGRVVERLLDLVAVSRPRAGRVPGAERQAPRPFAALRLVELLQENTRASASPRRSRPRVM